MNIDQLRRFFSTAIAPIKRKVNLMISRSVISSLSSKEGLQLLQLKLLANEVIDDAENFQEFGFISKPPIGSEAIALSVGGNREHLVVVATNNRAARKALQALLNSGDSMFFNNSQKYLLLKGDNLESNVEKLKIQNSQHEFVSVLIEFIEQVIVNKTITGIGPQPLIPSDVAALEAIKAKLETFKI